MKGPSLWRNHAVGALSALWLSALTPLAAAALQDDTSPNPAGCISASLPPDHWSVEALLRLESLGLADFRPSQRAAPICAVHQILDQALAVTEGGSSSMATLIEAWTARLEAEYPGLARISQGQTHPQLLGAGVGVELFSRSGAGAPGFGEYPPERTGMVALPNRTAAAAGGRITLQPQPWLSGAIAAGLDSDGWRLDQLEVVAGANNLAATVGRGRVGYGRGISGGVVLNGAVPLDRIQLETVEPFRLGSVLRPLGTLSLHTFLGRLRDDRHARRQFLWGGSGLLHPHRRVTLGVHRAAMFGGEGQDPISAGDLTNLLIGRVAGVGFEDQIVSVELVVHLPTESVLPVTGYIEWGSEDAAGAWHDVPGIVGGLAVPAIPDFPEASAGVEITSFLGSCCGNPPWYRHWAFPGSWAAREEPLGHPLGGQGSEVLIYSVVDLPEDRLRLDARGFWRERRGQNLFVPGREGDSYGTDLGVIWRVIPSGEVRLRLLVEDGSGWAHRFGSVQSTFFF